MNIGAIIKNLRKQKGLNQQEFSGKCELSQTALSQIETGVARPNKNTLERICLNLEVPEYVLYLLSIEESDVPEVKKQQFNELFPVIKELMLKLFYVDDSTLIK